MKRKHGDPFLRSVQNETFWGTAYENTFTYQMYLDRLIEISSSVFDWTNLPDSCDARTLERALLMQGKAIFFEDPELREYLTLPVNSGGSGFDVYGNPIGRTARSEYNNYHKLLDKTNSVMIYNNYMRKPSYAQLQQFAARLSKLDEIIDINTNAQKTPILILADESARLTMKNLYMKYDGNQPFIFGDKNLAIKDFSVLKTDAPYVADKLFMLKTQIWNEALTYLGISNVSFQKKERLVSDEVERNMGGVVANRNSRLAQRQIACEKINKMFGLDIWCEFNNYQHNDDSETNEDTVEDEVTDDE